MQNIPNYQQYYGLQQQMQQNFAATNPQYQGNQQIPQNFAATGQQMNPQKVIQSNPILSHTESASESPAFMLGATAISTIALSKLNDFINKPLLTKDYDNTLFKSIETTVDKFAQKPKMQAVANTLSTFKNKATTFINNSEILRTLFKKPSIGGPMVESQAAGAKGHLATRALDVMRKYKSANPGFVGFDKILAKAEKNSYKYYDEIIEAITKSGADVNQVIAKKPWWGFGLLKNEASLKEILNKDKLIQNYKAAGKTAGQKASGLALRGTECVTNGIFSGKGAILMQALMIAQSLKEATKAEKGEKFSTFMASFAELMAFMATSGIQQRVVNHVAGLKYIGMSVSDVQKYQKAMRIANNAAKLGNQKAYLKMTMVMDQLKNAAKANTKWYQKPIKWIGNIMSYGRINETLKPLKSSGIATKLAKIPYGLKVGAGYVGRFAFVMMVVIPIFSNLAKKLSYAIFGKPVKTIEREKREAEAAEQNNAQQTTASLPQQPIQPSQNSQRPPFTQQPMQTAPAGNLLDRLQNPQQYQQPLASQGLGQMPMASTPIQQSPDAGIKRTYIPNPVLGVEKEQSLAETRTARIDEVLRQADIAEMQAKQFL